MHAVILHIIAWVAILCICAYLLYCRYKSSPKEVIEFKTSMDLSGLPVITFYQGSNKFNFLLDTGSSASYLDIASTVERTDVPDAKADMIGIEGNKTECCISNVEFYRNDTKYTCTMRVLNMNNALSEIKSQFGISISGILGNDFFVKYKYCLDFKDLVAYRR